MRKILKFPLAIIDIGSNSCRLMLKDNGCKQKFLITTRLQEGKVDGVLDSASIDRTVNGVKALFDKALKLGANSVYIFATAAVRNSKNGEVVCGEIKRQTGIEAHVVSGELEAELALLGALNGKDGGIIDIGGGSTEVAVKHGGETVYSVSYKFGSVSLLNEFSTNFDNSDEFLKNNILAVRRRFEGDFVGVGGTITTLASISLGLDSYKPNEIQNHVITLDKIECLVNELKGLTKEDIIEKYPIASRRADIIAFGGQILINVMKAYGIKEIKVSDSDNLEGYLEYLSKDEKV